MATITIIMAIAPDMVDTVDTVDTATTTTVRIRII
jgi:hypothetical protein